MTTPPPPSVIHAFGGNGTPLHVTGGTGLTWRAGSIVLKPSDLAPEELEWQDELLRAVREDGFRVAPPVRSREGAFVVDGWTAWTWVEGGHEPARWRQIMDVGSALHRAVRDIPRPSFFDRRQNPWTIADQMAWGERPLASLSELELVRRLVGLRRPVRASSQVIHGDLTGNVLFAEGLPPAIIDLAPYWRPPAYGSAIVVVDALVWEGADARLVEELGAADGSQMLVRALLFRALTDLQRSVDPDGFARNVQPYASAVDLTEALVEAQTR